MLCKSAVVAALSTIALSACVLPPQNTVRPAYVQPTTQADLDAMRERAEANTRRLLEEVRASEVQTCTPPPKGVAYHLAYAAPRGSNWVTVEKNEFRITSYDRSSVGYYESNEPYSYFPNCSSIRGAVIKYQLLKVTPSRAPKVDTRAELTLFNCSKGTSVLVWTEMTYRGALISRNFSPESQLRMGFVPVIDQWNPVGSAADRIYHAVCNGH